jgi:hypothetical protein
MLILLTSVTLYHIDSHTTPNITTHSTIHHRRKHAEITRSCKHKVDTLHDINTRRITEYTTYHHNTHTFAILLWRFAWRLVVIYLRKAGGTQSHRDTEWIATCRTQRNITVSFGISHHTAKSRSTSTLETCSSSQNL